VLTPFALCVDNNEMGCQKESDSKSFSDTFIVFSDGKVVSGASFDRSE
jgi:hypothetical protein